MSFLQSQQEVEGKENRGVIEHTDDTVRVNEDGCSLPCNDQACCSATNDLYSMTSNERQQLVEERDAALEQLRWMEASRDELARQQGQYKGRIAKLEGAVSSGEKRLQATVQELEAVKAQCLQLQSERDYLHEQVGVTPERCRVERQSLQAKAKKAVKLVYETETRIKELAHIADHEAQQRQELIDFASIEHKAAADAENSFGTQIASFEAKLAEQTAALDAARKAAADAQAAAQKLEAELKEVKEAHAPCAAAAAKAQQEMTLLHSHVQQLSQDRAQAANNIRIAEKEVDLIHQANEQMFRYLNYVRSRLGTHLAELQHIPDLLQLLKDLHAWCTRESRGRVLTTPSQAPPPSKTPGRTPAPKGFASRTPVSSRSRLAYFGG
ncbi:g10378 [Coccomyxa elongata]